MPALYVEYPSGYKISDVPAAILAVPFVTSFLPVSMLLGFGIKVKNLDKTFAESVSDIKKAYKTMFPYLDLNFEVKSEAVVDCNYSPKGGNSLFFTGGMDATSALVEVANEHPLLVNIWGGDIGTSDNSSHENLEKYLEEVVKSLNTEYTFIKSNCREMYNEGKVTRLCALKILPWQNHGWWASIAHILSMSGLIAPLAYLRKTGTHYIASSYDQKSKIFDANNDTLLAAIRFGSCKLIPVDSNIERNDKAKKIIDFCNNTGSKFELKVCWYRKSGKNCSHCEKCYRTMLEIYANHGDPNKFGFMFTKQTCLEIKHFLETEYVNKGFWEPIQKRFNQERSYWSSVPEIAWILDIKFNPAKAVANKARQVLRKFI